MANWQVNKQTQNRTAAIRKIAFRWTIIMQLGDAVSRMISK